VTVAEAIQFYAPLVGLLALAFWSGRLSQRVTQLEMIAKELRAGEGIHSTLIERMIKVEVQIEVANETLASLKRGSEVMQRQLGNLMTGGGGKVFELPVQG